MRAVGRLGWGGVGGGGTLTPADLPGYLPQRINAGAFKSDPANSEAGIVDRAYGSGPGSTYSIYPTINFPQVSVGGAQYWYVETSPPIGWTSTQIKFRVHFIVDEAISLPGTFRFVLGARRNYDVSSPLGAKTTGFVDYVCADSTIPTKRITAISSAITIASAVDTDALFLELTRGIAASNDESDETYVTGIDLYFV